MKKQNHIHTGRTSIIKSLFTASIILILAGVSSAQSVTATDNFSAEIKHLGGTDDKRVFQVLLNNETGDKFIISIKDDESNILFQETYDEVKFEKNFILPIPAVDTHKLTFTIRSLKNNSTQTFKINTATRTVEDVVVTKLK